MKLQQLITLVFLLNISVAAMSQTVLYDIVIAGRAVGSVKVFRDDSDAENPKLRIDAEVSIPFYTGSLRSENQFADGSLKSSMTDYRVNGRKKEKVLTSKAALNQYQVDFFGSGEAFEKRKEVKHGITKTIVSLYYEEPVQVGAVYSEKYGQLCRVENLGGGRYGVVMPSGKQTTYTYAGGQCVEVAVELAGVKLRIVKKGAPMAITRN
jgi:hypothetical protein